MRLRRVAIIIVATLAMNNTAELTDADIIISMQRLVQWNAQVGSSAVEESKRGV